MGGALLETETRKIWNEAAKETALKLLKIGKLTIKEVAEATGLSISEAEHLRQQITSPVTV